MTMTRPKKNAGASPNRSPDATIKSNTFAATSNT